MVDVLVVSDEPWVIDAVRAALATAEYSLTEISNPHAAADHAATTDVAVVDLQIGSMGGMAVTRELRSVADPAPPIIVLLDRDADAFLASRAGASASVRKPLEGFALRDTIDGLLTGRAPVTG